MDLYNDKNFVRSLIIDHATRPVNLITKDKVPTNKNTFCYKTITDTCTDDLTLVLSTNASTIIGASFYGIGCAISTSSIDLLCNQLLNKDLDTAEQILAAYFQMIEDGTVTNDALLGDLVAFKNIYKQENRIMCAKSCALSAHKIIEDIKNHEHENN